MGPRSQQKADGVFIMPTDKEPVNNDILLLITRPSLQATALVHQLKSALAISVKIQNIQKPIESFEAERKLALVDLSDFDKKRTQHWQSELRRLRGRVKVLLFNVPEDYAFLNRHG